MPITTLHSLFRRLFPKTFIVCNVLVLFGFDSKKRERILYFVCKSRNPCCAIIKVALASSLC